MKRILVFVLMLLNVAYAMADVYTDGLRKLLNSNAMEFLVGAERLKTLRAPISLVTVLEKTLLTPW